MSQEYGKKAQEMSKQFKEITFIHIPIEENKIVDQLSQIAFAREEVPSQNEDIILQEKVMDPLNETDKKYHKTY